MLDDEFIKNLILGDEFDDCKDDLLYCKKNRCGLDISNKLQIEIRKAIKLMCEEWTNQCEDIFKI